MTLLRRETKEIRKRIVLVPMCTGVLVFALLCISCGRRGPAQPPFTPLEALGRFRIDGRFGIELYAAEPLLDGPVAMAFDGKGHAYVFESAVFPPKPSEPGRTRLLEDADGDGRPDHSILLRSDQQLPELPAKWKEERDRTFDSQGNCFITSPRSHLEYMAPSGEPRSISDHGESAPVFPITENPVYPVLTPADRTTSTCGIVYYSNPSVAGFARAIFTAEPVHNLVHCDLLSGAGNGLVARRARDGSELLASRDSWFRPVSFAMGPDGALYVVDYYAPLAGPTEVLEVGIKPSDCLLRSRGKGRIYRITPRPGTQPPTEAVADAGQGPSDDPGRESKVPALPADPAGLENLIGNPLEMDTVQAAAVRALGRFAGDAPAAFLLSKWRALTALPRAEAMEALFKEPIRLRMLLEALEREQMPLWCLDEKHRIRLLESADRLLAERARGLLEAHDPGRNPTVKKYEAALRMRGTREAGEMVYKRLCGRCHTYRGGSNYGPDLWAVSSRPLRRTMIDILLPSESMAPGRELFMIDLDAWGVEGIIGSQTETSINILHDESRQETVFRRDIRRLLMADFSAMPVDLASQITVQDMADLLQFLTTR